MLKHLSGPDTPPSRVVMVGRSGFVATYLTTALSESGVPVMAVGRPEVDLTLSSSVEALGALIHADDTVVILSALTPDKGRDVGTLMKNIRMAEHLCEVFVRSSCAHVVYISSDAVYDGHDTPIDEESHRQPADLYALMHTSREMMLQSVLGPLNIPYCVLRPVALFGPGDTHNSYGPNRFVRDAAASRRIALFGNGEEQRNHLFMHDAARLIALCIANRSEGTLNLLGPEPVSFGDVARMVSDAFPWKVEIECKPRPPGSVIVHRTYSAERMNTAFPAFRFTPMNEAIPAFVQAYLAVSLPRAN